MDERDRLETEIAIEADHAERADRKVASLDEISRRVHRDRIIFGLILAAVLVVLAIVAVGLVLKYADDAEDDRQQDQLEQQYDDIVAARKEGRAATCDGFEAFTNALAGASDRPINELREQARQFVADLERRLGPLDCDIHLDILTDP